MSLRRVGLPDPWRVVAPVSEFAGTAAVLFVLVSARVLVWHPDSAVAHAVSSPSLRIAIAALTTGVAIVAVIRSPIGRLSGGHLNPAVTIAFALHGMVAPFELVAYPIAQCLGAVLGAAAATAVWGDAADLPHVVRGVTSPAAGWAPVSATAVEAVFVAVLVLTAFAVLSRHSMLRAASLIVPAVLVVGVGVFARRSGAAFNPARALGPDVVAGKYAGLGVFVVGPISGALVGSLVWSWFGRRPVLTPKLDHRHGYPCFFRHCRLHPAPDATSS